MRRLSLLLVALTLAIVALALPMTALAAEGSISGHVTPTSIAAEVEVCVVEVLPSETCTYPAADGSYSLVGLTATPVKVEFIPSHRSHYLLQYWERADSLSQAKLVPLSANHPKATGVDGELVLGGAIEGTVTGPGGTALRGVEICALAARQTKASACAQTAADGGYELPGPPAASYRVEFLGRGPSAEYASQYYGSGALIPLAAGEVRGGVDGELARGAQVRGAVTALVGGVALAGVPVCLFVASSAIPEQCGFSDPSGQYAFVGLAAGSYQVGFSLTGAELGGEDRGLVEDDYLSQYYDGVANRAAARLLTLAAGETASGVNAGLLTPAPSAAAPQVVPPADPLVAAPPPIAEPRPPAKGCRRDYVKKKSKGKTRCIKAKHRHPHHKPKRSHRTKGEK